jgi:hypothetical protein
LVEQRKREERIKSVDPTNFLVLSSTAKKVQEVNIFLSLSIFTLCLLDFLVLMYHFIFCQKEVLGDAPFLLFSVIGGSHLRTEKNVKVYFN